MRKHELFFVGEVEYETEMSLGQGGSAVVWKVRRKLDGEVFAVKRIEKDSTANSARNKRFEQEIEYGQTTRHPNVVRIHASTADEKFYYYVMDFYPMTLRDVINVETNPDVLLHYTRQLCEALAHVHGEGMVHRDIKPENVLVDPNARRLVLADFGIAHFKESMLTKRGDLLVNRNYLAPEQMIRNNAQGVGKPADIFALGLVITEMFTKQNPRGGRHALVRDLYPYLGDLDPIVEQMMLQDESRRLGIDNVHGLLRVMRRRIRTTIKDLAQNIRPTKAPAGVSSGEIERSLDRVARDLLSAKHVFKRVADEELSRYNINYHCEISYSVSVEVFNSCAQAIAYSMCKSKFDYEGAGTWDEHDDALVISADKPKLLREFEKILADFPIPRGSRWASLPRQSSHLFRFCKDYHCDELLTSIRAAVYGTGSGSLQANLISAPIFWVALNVRKFLNTDYFEFDQTAREEIGFEHHLSVLWNETFPLDKSREATGAELFNEPFNADGIANAIMALESKWDASVGEIVGGDYSVIFRSRVKYRSFRDEALALAEPGSVFEADILNLLRPEAEYDDLVALTWGRDFDVAVTLGKILGTRTR